MSNQVRAPWIFGAKDQRHRGVEVENDGKLLTVTEAIKAGGLDWMVELREFESSDDDRITGAGHKMTVKVEDVMEDGQLVKSYLKLGIVKGRYTLLQNRAAFSFFDRATMDGAAVIKAVGHLDHGRVVWAIAQRPDTMELVPGDAIHQNLVLVTAHDGSHAVKVMFNPYRASTGTMLGIRAGNRRTAVTVKHTKSIDIRMATAHNVLAAESGYFERWRTALVGDDGQSGFKRRLVTSDEINSVVNGLFKAQKKTDEDGISFEKVSGKAEKARGLIIDRIDEQRERSRIAYEDADQEAPNGATALDVFLGVGEYISKDRKAKNEGNNWVVSTFGSGSKMRQDAFALISKLK